MRLIPDIQINGHIISMQDPYTIDGALIVHTERLGNNIRIVTRTNNYQLDKVYLFNIESFNNFIRRSYRYYINETFFDENGCISEHPRNFDSYLSAIRIYNLSSLSTTSLNRVYQRLIRQRRLPLGECVVPSSSLEPNMNNGNITGRQNYFSSAGTLFSNNFYFNVDLLYERFSHSNIKKYIHPYNYKPKYVNHKLDTEDTPLLLGAEIEVAENTNENEKDNRESVVKKCIQIMNGSDTDDENLIYSTSDSTVQIELDTMPCSLEYHKTLNYKQMFEYLDKQGYKGHDANSAGLHIHADRKYLGKTELMQQLTISKILYILEKFNDEICVIARRNNSYSQFVGNGKNETSIVDLYGKYKNNGKRVALNLQHPETIEFRCFRSTLKYETFILTLEFVQDIIDYVKSINIEEIELIQWNDLMKTFSDELREYYNERLAKIKKDQMSMVEFKQNVASFEENISRMLNDYVSIPAYSTNEYHTVGRNLDFNYNPEAMATRFNDTYQSLVNSSASVELAEQTHEVNLTEEDTKKYIRKLKIQIKNCRNYLEKKKLEKELTEYQKKLKKLKKQKKPKKRQLNSIYGYQVQMS
nr:MAG TPA: Putative amidoligase enzyme [Bacteriophage sp.]